MSAEQRAKLRAAQLAYVAGDPRWAAHRQKLADAQTARRMTLFPNEVDAVLKMRTEGRSFREIARKIGVACDIIRREIRERGLVVPSIPAARRMTLLPNEITAILRMRAKGRTFSYIEQEIGVCCSVIRRELRKDGYSTAPVKADKRAKGGKGFWRSFEEANPVVLSLP